MQKAKSKKTADGPLPWPMPNRALLRPTAPRPYVPPPPVHTAPKRPSRNTKQPLKKAEAVKSCDAPVDTTDLDDVLNDFLESKLEPVKETEDPIEESGVAAEESGVVAGGTEDLTKESAEETREPAEETKGPATEIEEPAEETKESVENNVEDSGSVQGSGGEIVEAQLPVRVLRTPPVPDSEEQDSLDCDQIGPAIDVKIHIAPDPNSVPAVPHTSLASKLYVKHRAEVRKALSTEAKHPSGSKPVHHTPPSRQKILQTHYSRVIDSWVCKRGLAALSWIRLGIISTIDADVLINWEKSLTEKGYHVVRTEHYFEISE